jgi:hypothetical protein
MDGARNLELDLDHLHTAIVPTREADAMGQCLGLAVGALDERFQPECVMRTPPVPPALGYSSFW